MKANKHTSLFLVKVTMNKKLSKAALGGALLFLILPLSLVITRDIDARAVQIQDNEKVIEKLNETYMPLEVVEFKKKNQDLALGKKFKGGDDWLENLSFTVKNISNKPIIYIQFHLNFPETKATGDIMSYRWEVGQVPESKFKRRSNPITLNPGETLHVNIYDKYHELSRFLETRHSPKDLKESELRMGVVIFADRTAWVSGTFLRQDPTKPDRFIPDSSINFGSTPPL